jgi:oligopeptide transport system ATP-binding protein
MENKQIVLSVKNLRVNFSTDHGYVQAVRGVSFDLYKGETLCIVGESGSGKSVTSKTIMGILASNGRIVDGSIMYEGEDLTKVSEDEFHRIRGHKIGMIFQDPLSSLNPIVRIGKQITEAMLINASRTRKIYEEEVSDELVAYKNAITELKSGLAKYTENIKFLKSEKKKEINKARSLASNEISSRLYTLKQDFGVEEFKISEAYQNTINSLNKKLEKEEISKDEYNSSKQEALDIKNEKLATLVAKYKEDKEAVKAEVSSLKEKAKLQEDKVREEYDEKIALASENAKDAKAELKAKYNPIIKETRIAFKAKEKVAKQKVREYKANILEKHRENKKRIIEDDRINHPNKTLLYIRKDLKKERKRYISQLRISKAEAKERALKIMKEVGISEPEKRFRQYPFEFSGGMRQRIVIAIALTADPDIIICDEPTTALDVTIQAQILELINRLKVERNLSCIFITHDLGVVANMADRVAVMYAGKIVEYGTEDEIFYDPRHPYTWALLSSIPDIDSNEKLEAIPGTPPNMIYPPVGDAFALRSKYAMAIDFKKEPPLFKVSETHYAATWLLDPRAPKVEMPKIVKTRIANSLKANKKGGKK